MAQEVGRVANIDHPRYGAVAIVAGGQARQLHRNNSQVTSFDFVY